MSRYYWAVCVSHLLHSHCALALLNQQLDHTISSNHSGELLLLLKPQKFSHKGNLNKYTSDYVQIQDTT